jgi:hypothetical protein
MAAAREKGVDAEAVAILQTLIDERSARLGPSTGGQA